MDFTNPRTMEISIDDPEDTKGMRRLKYDKNYFDKNNKGRLNTCTLGVVNLFMFLFAVWMINASIHSRRSEEIEEYYESLKIWKSGNVFSEFSNLKIGAIPYGCKEGNETCIKEVKGYTKKVEPI